MTRAWWIGLLLLAPWTGAAAGDALVRRIEERAAALHELQELYESTLDAVQRRAILERVFEEAAWLEQIGGMKSARAGALLGLARWELLKLEAPPSHGFLGNEKGDARPSMLVRRPGADELPAALASFKDRLLFIQLHNEDSQPLLLGRPSLELSGGLGPLKTSELSEVKDWPAELRALARWGKWPERLDGQGQVTLLAWLRTEQSNPLGLSIPVRWSEEDDPPRSLRAVFHRESDPDGVAQARREALRREADIRKKLENQATHNGTKPEPTSPEPKPPRPEAPVERIPQGERVPPELGKVERAGDGATIQVRLKAAAFYEPNRKLRVRKAGRWVGVLRLNESDDRTPNKTVYWATIVEGERKELIEGTLHEQP